MGGLVEFDQFAWISPKAFQLSTTWNLINATWHPTALYLSTIAGAMVMRLGQLLAMQENPGLIPGLS